MKSMKADASFAEAAAEDIVRKWVRDRADTTIERALAIAVISMLRFVLGMSGAWTQH